MEILSPASNMEHIQVAIDGKANAVYGGVKKWNARNKAINFTDEEYNQVIEKLHDNNIKFFLTLNILMLDEEIEEVISFLKKNKLPDAFIVADLGLALALKDNFPTTPLHFSTQFGCHNIDDINYVESLGGERGILARELTLDEIKKIKNNTNIELECFIWGSQCLSFSGLCFFGTLINGGGGNRGKCIITCRDIYQVNDEKGHFLYVPDMNCINLKSKLEYIDCLKLEGRRRNPQEILKVLNEINNNNLQKKDIGYLNGTNIIENGLYEKINSRVKPYLKASEIKNICHDDICIEYKNDIPYKFSNDYFNQNVYYMYTEIKKDYSLIKKNLWFDVKINDNKVDEIIYVNHKGDGHTFFRSEDDFLELDINKFINDIEEANDEINIYKVKYQKNQNNKNFISKRMYAEIFEYVLNDCQKNKKNRSINKMKFKNIYLETNNMEVIDRYINDNFIKIIYNIETIDNLKKIKNVITKYDDKIIYKLPIFNWKSENIILYLEELKNKEVMYTRLTQIYLTQHIKFKKKYTDYTIYIWNKKILNYLKENGIEEFTASSELSYKKNKNIFGNDNMQTILCGRLPLVYTRNCFQHIFGCQNCIEERNKNKKIKNIDKNLNLEIACNSDYRYVFNKNLILNNFTDLDVSNNTFFRYVTIGETIENIEETINAIKNGKYYEELINNERYFDSYECNVMEGKE